MGNLTPCICNTPPQLFGSSGGVLQKTIAYFFSLSAQATI